MGANAGTAVPTYASGDVLTAANLNLTNSGAPVFADSSARDGAFGSGKKTLAEGQLCYLEDSNIVQYYDGSSWATVGPAAASALTLISATTIGTSVTSVTVSSAFSSTYDNYKIIVSGGVSTGNGAIDFQLGSTNTGYYNSYFRNPWSGATQQIQTSNGSGGVIGVATTNFLYANVDILGPNLAQTTAWAGTFVEVATNLSSAFVGGFVNNTTQYTAFTIFNSTMTGGTIRVYGYQNS